MNLIFFLLWNYFELNQTLSMNINSYIYIFYKYALGNDDKIIDNYIKRVHLWTIKEGKQKKCYVIIPNSFMFCLLAFGSN